MPWCPGLEAFQAGTVKFVEGVTGGSEEFRLPRERQWSPDLFRNKIREREDVRLGGPKPVWGGESQSRTFKNDAGVLKLKE